MKKSIILTALVLAALLVLVGCASTPKIGDLLNDTLQGKGDELSEIIGSIGGDIIGDIGGEIGGGSGNGNADVGADNSVEAIFTDYQDRKGQLIRTINGITLQDADMGISTSMSFINIYEVDGAMWPSEILWEDQEDVKIVGSFFGVTNMEIDKSKNHAVISYLDENDRQVTFTADYDEANGRFLFTSESENGNRPVMEIIRTPYGFAGQSYTGGLGMLENLYLISMEGDKGIIGVIHETSTPSPLTGNETFEFPKEAAVEWYHYENGRLVGVARDGSAIDLNAPDGT